MDALLDGRVRADQVASVDVRAPRHLFLDDADLALARLWLTEFTQMGSPGRQRQLVIEEDLAAYGWLGNTPRLLRLILGLVIVTRRAIDPHAIHPSRRHC